MSNQVKLSLVWPFLADKNEMHFIKSFLGGVKLTEGKDYVLYVDADKVATVVTLHEPMPVPQAFKFTEFAQQGVLGLSKERRCHADISQHLTDS